MSSDTTPETPLSQTPRTTLRRHRERAATDRAELYAVLDAGLICHLGVVADGAPVVLPTAYGRSGDTLYLHGSSANGAFMAARGQQICVTVTHMDGLVAARSVFNHSMNYRSAVVFGTASAVLDEDERWHALELITDHLIPGRWAAARQPTKKEIAATAVISLPLAEASVKIRTGMPVDEPEDYALDVWAGVLPIAVTFGEPAGAPEMPAGTEVPAHIRERVGALAGGRVAAGAWRRARGGGRVAAAGVFGPCRLRQRQVPRSVGYASDIAYQGRWRRRQVGGRVDGVGDRWAAGSVA
jgi:nitroimidazol reductase NimA-like FMN-containing flavoprotein (pyridoxamine 5'-phosphate oxidase superfamily)